MSWRVLVVDDQVDHRELMRDALERYDPALELVEAVSGEAALQALAQDSFDAIVLDYMLPDTTALELIPRVQEAAPEAAIVVTTARGDEQTAVDVLQAGASDYLIKSRNLPENLPRALERALETRRLRQEAQRAHERAAHLNSILLALREISRLIAREPDRDNLLAQVCQGLVSSREYAAAWIISAADAQGRPFAHHCGLQDEEFAQFVERLSRGQLPECLQMAQRAPGEVILIPQHYDHQGCPLAPLHGSAAIMASALRLHDTNYGLIGVTIAAETMEDTEEQELFGDLAADVAMALYSIDARERREEAEAALKRSEEQFRQLIEKAPVGIVIRRGLDLVYVNPALLSVLGYRSQEEVPENSVLSLYAPETRDEMRERILSRDQGVPVPTSYDVVAYTSQGQRILHRLEVARVTLPDGPAAMGFHTDISYRVRIEQNLREQIAEKEHAQRILLRQQEELRSMVVQTSLAEERERRRVGTELHDTVVQFLAFAKLKLNLISREALGPEALHALDEVEQLLQEAINRSRSVMYELSAFSLYELGFEEALHMLCERYQKEHALRVIFDHDDRPKPLPPDLQVLLFQAARELLNNAVQHADAATVLVRLLRVNDEVQLSVQGEGLWANLEALTDPERSGFGLFSLRERLRYLNGTLDVASSDGGTTVTIDLPLQASPIGEPANGSEAAPMQ